MFLSFTQHSAPPAGLLLFYPRMVWGCEGKVDGYCSLSTWCTLFCWVLPPSWEIGSIISEPQVKWGRIQSSNLSESSYLANGIQICICLTPKPKFFLVLYPTNFLSWTLEPWANQWTSAETRVPSQMKMVDQMTAKVLLSPASLFLLLLG